MTDIDRVALGILLVAAAEADLEACQPGHPDELMRALLRSVIDSDDPLEQARRVAKVSRCAATIRRVLDELDPPSTPRSVPPAPAGSPPPTHTLSLAFAGGYTEVCAVSRGDRISIGTGPYLGSLHPVAEDGLTVEVSVWGDELPAAHLTPIRRSGGGYEPSSH